MPRAHFECPFCHQLYDLRYSVADVDGPDWPPVCLDCDVFMELAPQPGDYKFDLRSDAAGSSSRQKFVVHRQVPDREGNLVQVAEEISSTQQIRKIEAESERRFANGEGEPLRFRAFSQDRGTGGMQESSFGKSGTVQGRAYDSGHTPQKKRNISVRRHGQDSPDIPTHPIGGTSPLGGVD